MRKFESNGVSIEKTFISGGGSTVICRRILLFYQNVLKTILQTILKNFKRVFKKVFGKCGEFVAISASKGQKSKKEGVNDG